MEEEKTRLFPPLLAGDRTQSPQDVPKPLCPARTRFSAGSPTRDPSMELPVPVTPLMPKIPQMPS